MIRFLSLAVALIPLPFLEACSRTNEAPQEQKAGPKERNAVPKVSSGIEGRWVMPRSWSMRIESNFRPDGTYRQEFLSDVKESDGITTGKYEFDSHTGVLTYGHLSYYRASVNGLELLIREDSWANWKAKKQIYVTLIKISDDPYLEAGHIEEGDPILERLFSNGVGKPFEAGR